MPRRAPSSIPQWLQARAPQYANSPATIHDVTVAQATVAARGNNINTVDDIASAGIFDDRLYVQGTKMGQFMVMVDLSQPAPPLQTSVQQAQTMDQQQIQQQQLVQQQLNQTGPQGPVIG